jgi:hypothetical protein
MNKILTILFISIFSISMTGFSLDTRSLGFINEGRSDELTIGNQYLLVIGISRYHKWLPLSNPVRDAREIRDIITSRYHIDKVRELYDEEATKSGIIRTFSTLQDELTTDDSVLIFYAGHGHYDKKTKTGFWIPYDAGTDVFEQDHWIPNTQISGLITNMNATHVCLITDACFSGDMLDIVRGSVATITNDYFRRAYSLVSRQIITSGSLEVVPDNSSFCTMLKLVLKKNRHSYLDPMMLFNEIRLGVRETTPLFGSLKDSGHQDGASFLLFLKPEPVPDHEEKAAAALVKPDGDKEGENGVSGEKAQPEVEEEMVSEGKKGDSSVTIQEETYTLLRNREPDISGKIEAGQEEHAEWVEDFFFSAGIGCGIAIPLGSVVDTMEPGISSIVSLRFNLAFPWGICGLGIQTGAGNLSTKKSFETAYDMLTFPISFQAVYMTSFMFPLYAFCEVGCGLSLNAITFRESYDGLDDLVTAKFFVSPAIGAGLFILPEIWLETYAAFSVIFFDNTIYTGMTPGVQLKYIF